MIYFIIETNFSCKQNVPKTDPMFQGIWRMTFSY